MSKVYIGLGSNKNDRIEYLNQALLELEQTSGISIIELSSFYETKPFGVENQQNYYNAVVLIETFFSPTELYEKLKQIEKSVGRTKSFRWGPREIDLDIILFDSLVYLDQNLQIPHKDYIFRDFVLVPLLEISPDLIDPQSKLNISEFQSTLEENYIIRKIENNVEETLGAEIV